jgi:apolipoprotein N-acyltransferase
MTTISLAQKKDSVITQAAAMRFALGIALSALSGVMLLLSFPPYGLWPLAWFGLVPALLAQYRLLPAKWASLAPTRVWAFLPVSWPLDCHPPIFHGQRPEVS